MKRWAGNVIGKGGRKLIMRRIRDAKYWRNIVIFLVLSAFIGLIIIGAYIASQSVRAAKASLFPPHILPLQTPTDYGIEVYENVRFTTDDSIRLNGWYIPPESENGMVILMAHGYAHNRETFLPEAKILTEHGYGALLFDFRGHGESEEALVTLGDREQLDLRAAIDFVSSQPNVNRLGAIGFSMGAAALVGVAVEDERIEAIVVEGLFPTLKEEIWHRSRVYWWFSQVPVLLTIRGEGVELDDVRPIDRLCSISPRKLLLIYGELDQDVPPGSADAMFAAACDPVEMWIVPFADHRNFVEIVQEEYSARLLRFFE